MSRLPERIWCLNFAGLRCFPRPLFSHLLSIFSFLRFSAFFRLIQQSTPVSVTKPVIPTLSFHLSSFSLHHHAHFIVLTCVFYEHSECAVDGVEEAVDDHFVDVIDVGLPAFRLDRSGEILPVGSQKTVNRLTFLLDVVVSVIWKTEEETRVR